MSRKRARSPHYKKINLHIWDAPNIIRYYTNKIRLRGLTQNQGFVRVAKPLLWGDSAVGGFPDL
ncbi:MAG: hypothetical protein KME23_18645 [Goleter apudmare HA4340-LM2]|jgi:hypothetical protein|nr:hypothetical protein [Goleter apudmare HA4340-LM2]